MSEPVASKPEFDIERFRADIQVAADRRGVTTKQISKATGVSQTTLARMKKGRCPDAASMAALCGWAGINPRKYLREAMRQCAGFGVEFSRAQREPIITADDVRRIVREELERASTPQTKDTA